ncbi:vesicle-associated membrane protein 5 [Rhinophrynus dorsalis]
MCQRNAEEVTVLMKNNVNKVIEREGKLSDMEERSQDLLSMATSFQKTAKTVERHTRWEKYRWYVICGGIVLLIVIIIVIVIVVVSQQGGGESENP